MTTRRNSIKDSKKLFEMLDRFSDRISDLNKPIIKASDMNIELKGVVASCVKDDSITHIDLNSVQ